DDAALRAGSGRRDEAREGRDERANAGDGDFLTGRDGALAARVGAADLVAVRESALSLRVGEGRSRGLPDELKVAGRGRAAAEGAVDLRRRRSGRVRP